MCEWTDDMGQVSGFGGSYEAGLRAMVVAGYKWLIEHPEKQQDIKFSEFKNVTGLCFPESESAKELENAILDAEINWGGEVMKCREEATGAMLQYAIHHSCFAAKNGWEAYQKMMRERGKNAVN